MESKKFIDFSADQPAGKILIDWLRNEENLISSFSVTN